MNKLLFIKKKPSLHDIEDGYFLIPNKIKHKKDQI